MEQAVNGKFAGARMDLPTDTDLTTFHGSSGSKQGHEVDEHDSGYAASFTEQVGKKKRKKHVKWPLLSLSVFFFSFFFKSLLCVCAGGATDPINHSTSQLTGRPITTNQPTFSTDQPKVMVIVERSWVKVKVEKLNGPFFLQNAAIGVIAGCLFVGLGNKEADIFPRVSFSFNFLVSCCCCCCCCR